ncbi:MAG: 4Fe-4S ferredoxin [Candidatus Margulisbacteria bacterium GWF2_35_9]|nr:MAG: 4Fe-4S ferredoxin [Candidatus Margulisbacteria bacterium GWF2_35_9]
MLKIESIKGHNRLSSQELLQQIYAAMAEGETEFDITACGQHDIGGPLWTSNGKPLTFTITDPGQRVGSMCMENTTIIVNGSAPADVGWLNAGGTIIVKGDGGDTTAHCAAAGKIYIGGRVGTRSGSLMKRDPKFESPEFWILKSTGSFSFEFMGGGIGIVCGYGCEDLDSVMGDRACVGMVGGTVYVRGKVKGLYTADVGMYPLEKEDKEFLLNGMKPFLKAIDKPNIEKELTKWNEWQKIVPKSYEQTHSSEKTSINKFRNENWVEEGIFSDVFPDQGQVIGLVSTGDNRIRYPKWENIKSCAPCEYHCPVSIPSQKRYNLLREGRYKEALDLIYYYSPFPRTVCGQVCPNMCMEDCSRKALDKAVDIKGLGSVSQTKATETNVTKEQKIAVVGAGVGGLTTAWHLKRMGYDVTVYERDKQIGGKLVYAVSRDRLTADSLENDLSNFKKIGINYQLETEVDEKLYKKLKKEYAAVVLATGAYTPKVPPWSGKERLKYALDFLADVNTGKKPKIGKKVVVIGAGNTGMDVVFGAYRCGATEVTAIDVQKPSAFHKEIEHAESMGAKIKWPVFTKEITDKGVVLSTGELIEADTVILAIGEVPNLSYISDKYVETKGYINVGDDFHLVDNVYTIGDITNLGLLADAIGHGRELAMMLDAKFMGREYAPCAKQIIDKNKLVVEYFDSVHDEKIIGRDADVNRCISCGTCRDCRICKDSCPEKAISRIQKEDNSFEYVVDETKCIGCGICDGVCPCGIWQLYANAPLVPNGKN